MTKTVDRTAFLSEPTRLRIAELCSEEALTLEEIAERLQRPSGSLSQPRTMRKHRALIAAKKRGPSDSRGPAKAYRFNSSSAWKEALDEARLRQRPSWATANQDLLLIPLHGTAAACAAIAAGIDEIEWGARVGSERFGLVVAPEADIDGVNLIRVVEALGSDPEIARLQVGRVMGPGELREWSAQAASRSSAVGELSRCS